MSFVEFFNKNIDMKAFLKMNDGETKEAIIYKYIERTKPELLEKLKPNFYFSLNINYNDFKNLCSKDDFFNYLMLPYLILENINENNYKLLKNANSEVVKQLKLFNEEQRKKENLQRLKDNANKIFDEIKIKPKPKPKKKAKAPKAKAKSKSKDENN